ncbi:hypothetical protein F2981_28620 (plasmid) [Sinorhizobium meliloti]|nr:hypothetical protein [Sinorhizobium meliloti]
MLKAIAGALPVWGGAIGLGGETISNLPVHEVVRQGLVLMPQGGGVFPRLTVMENLRMAATPLPTGSSWTAHRGSGRPISIAGAAGGKTHGRSPFGRRTGDAGAGAARWCRNPRFILLDRTVAGLSPAMVSETLERIKVLTRARLEFSWSSRTFARPCRLPTGSISLAAGEKRFEGTPEMSATTDRSWTSIWAVPDAAWHFIGNGKLCRELSPSRCHSLP